MAELITTVEVENAINEKVQDWSISGPYLEEDGKYHALLRGKWLGNGYLTRQEALKAVLSEVSKED